MNLPTDRELEVLNMICQGMADKEIANALGISVRTAETHHADLYNKMFANPRGRNGVHLLRRAIELGLVPCPCKAVALRALAITRELDDVMSRFPALSSHLSPLTSHHA